MHSHDSEWLKCVAQSMGMFSVEESFFYWRFVICYALSQGSIMRHASSCSTLLL